MGLETAAFISSLDTTNPVATDKRKQGDDHLRLIKTAIKGSFPNSDRAWYLPVQTAKSANFTILSSQQNVIFIVTTTGGSVTGTLPTLTSGDVGWECSFMKVSGDVNPIFVAPPSGTLTSGEYFTLAKARRAIPGRIFKALWTGSAWWVQRVNTLPVGAVFDCEYPLSTAPVGYEYAAGATLSSASSNYPEYFSVRGSGVLPDRAGLVAAGRDNMSGSAAGWLTAGNFGSSPNTIGNRGGSEKETLTSSHIPAHTHSFSATTSSSGTHTHTVDGNAVGAGGTSKYLGSSSSATGFSQTTSSDGAHTHTVSGTTGSYGGGNAHNNTQPTTITNFLVVVE